MKGIKTFECKLILFLELNFLRRFNFCQIRSELEFVLSIGERVKDGLLKVVRKKIGLSYATYTRVGQEEED